ncbi:hypothetical protein M422DRAFT_268047 [Sphaerobolus stellatus SS14]|uniref:G-protein coupled receptors family 1 profile domain-containing protein n=1 Tax=Sphaerobolus stellatus (strain SS14) TaxID=990650 RepID=A0A0C9UNH9_SPHS4|nr:hypothetical protein M422DRAFT_268047 [Sphaerobolus stellatus SS14]
MATVQGFAVAISTLNFVGSISSFLGADVILACYLVLPRKRHFRHVLILNLAVADCFNALGNCVSGLYILVQRQYETPGPACIANGFIEQFTVQGTDCAILAIAIITVHALTRTRGLAPSEPYWPAKTVIIVTAAIWILPLFTSILALIMKWYAPASGSWCWLVANPKYIRYILTHGWRFLFILIEIGLYLYLHLYLRKHYRRMAEVMDSQTSTTRVQAIPPTSISYGNSNPSIANSSPNLLTSSNPSIAEKRQDLIGFRSPMLTGGANQSRRVWILGHRGSNSHSGSERHHPRYKPIQRVLLLNAYPLAYLILWIPGIVNRLIEASGHSSRVTQILQASTQFVGLANALTYGWNEQIAEQFRIKFWSH